MNDEQAFVKELLERKERLYESRVKPLEAEHTGKWAAVSHDGEVILADREGEAGVLGTKAFGRGNYEALRVGYPVYHEWVTLFPVTE